MGDRVLLVAAATAVVSFAVLFAHAHPPATAAKAPVPPPGDADNGGLPGDVLCSVYGGSGKCGGDGGVGGLPQRPAPSGPRSRSRRQAQAEELDQDQICAIFSGPTCPPDKNKVYTPCECSDGALSGCECVPYYQCDNVTGKVNTDGSGLIDIRQKPDGGDRTCEHYLHQCCKIRDGAAPNNNNNNNNNNNPTHEPLTQHECGVRNRNGVGIRISGNNALETNFGEIPWMVAISKKQQSSQKYICGGGLIAPAVVLTAAHCVYDSSPQSLTVRAGEWDSRTEDEAFKHQDRDVAEVITHPDYRDKILHSDVALLVLRSPVKVGFHIGTICLPEQGQRFDGANCLVSGWGKENFNAESRYQSILRSIEDLPVVPHDSCEEKLRRTRLGPYFRLNRSFMCAGGEAGKDACTGDGGSPLVCPLSSDEEPRYAFAGIVSWGVGCGEQDVPGVYADVALFRSWIDQQLADRQISVDGR